MAMAAKQLLCFFILAILGLSMVATEVMAGGKGNYGPGSLKSYQCGPQCTRRCSRTQYRKPCLFFCNKCCTKCLCVPPGFYGNKAVCPCYNNWKTQQGGPKCP
ncbi:Gibberellin-regulated protein 6 [Linum perenne]